jgi:hypothetical protein
MSVMPIEGQKYEADQEPPENAFDSARGAGDRPITRYTAIPVPAILMKGFKTTSNCIIDLDF